MITLKVEEYCHNCPDFSAKVAVKEKEKVCEAENLKIRVCETTVTCSHAKRCEGIKRYLDKINKDVTHIVNET